MFIRTFSKVIILSILSAFHSYGQDLDSLLNMSVYTTESELQKVLNQNLTVSSAKALTARETPGIISLITAEEIQNSGARDITDILRMVPGFDIAQDLQFVMGLGLRGSWATEGKVLIMMDGQPFNELLYQGVAVGNRFPVYAIERIEIIRGPGSAIYGGSAEYGVINIITMAAEKLNGVHVYGIAGFHEKNVGRTNGGFAVARKSKNISWDLSLFKGKGIISDQEYTSLHQDTSVVNLAEATHADPLNINAGIKIKNFQLRGMYDQFTTSEPFTYVSFKNLFVDAKYDWKINSKVTITPQVKYFNQIPWQFGYFSDEEDYLRVRAERYYGSLSAVYDVSRKINVNAGVLYFKDLATDLLNSDYLLGNNTVSFNNVAVFGQAFLKHRLVNATLGFRYERNNQYGDAFVPRLALTKKIENFHFKILYSKSFRAPAIENINLSESGSIKPEKSQAFELELGYQFTPEMLLSVNAFSLRTRDIIVYAATITNPLGEYNNFDKSGSQGIELVYNIRMKNWYSYLTYSFSHAAQSNTVALYAVPQTTKQFAGLPIHKITFNTNIYVTPNISLNPTIVWAGKRYAYASVDENDESVSNEFDPYGLVNTFINYKHIIPGLTVGIGLYDILNQKPPILQAYNGDYAPVPGRSREYIIKLSYQLDFKK
jgi:outer membrane receptor for ferrienterochelin and colicin